MFSAAERMKSLGRQAQDEGTPSSIFGSAAGLARAIDSDEAVSHRLLSNPLPGNTGNRHGDCILPVLLAGAV